MSKSSQQATYNKLRMEMSDTAKRMCCGILETTIRLIQQGIVVDGYDMGIVCSHLRCIMNVVHKEDVPFEMGMNGDTTNPPINKLLQLAVEDLDWKKEWDL